MFCKNCGKEVPEDARFCPQCGSPVSIASESPEPPVFEEVKEDEPELASDNHVPQNVQGAAPQGIACPKCGSSDLKIERFTWWGGILGAALADRLTCRTCGYKFKIKR